MKMQSVVLWALLLLGSSAVAGCGTGSGVRSDWESARAGGLGPDCHNIEHLGYGIHRDIVLTPQIVAIRSTKEAP